MEASSNSTHKVEVFRIDKVLSHPNADALEILHPFGGYQCVVKKGEWEVGDLAAYVPPDSLVPLDRPEFAWLGETGRTPKSLNGKLYHRVTAIKLRKEPSLGLVIPLTAAWCEGTDLASELGVLHYDPPEKRVSGGRNSVMVHPWWLSAFKPPVSVPVYDLESLRRFSGVFQEGEEVWVSEKIHGANARYVWALSTKRFILSRDGLRVGPFAIRWGGAGRRGFSIISEEERHLWVGSRTQWRLKGDNDWWKALRKYPQIVRFLRNNPGFVIYGEVYGDVQDLRYGKGFGEVDFAAFDLRRPDGIYEGYFSFNAIMDAENIPTVPMVKELPIPFSLETILKMAEGPSMVEGAKHLREGVVVRPLKERLDPRVGRVVMKVVSTDYLERQK